MRLQKYKVIKQKTWNCSKVKIDQSEDKTLYILYRIEVLGSIHNVSTSIHEMKAANVSKANYSPNELHGKLDGKLDAQFEQTNL